VWEGRLVKRLISEAEKLGIRLLSVKPVAGNVEAIKFFYHQGFKNIGYIELFMDFSKRQCKKDLDFRSSIQLLKIPMLLKDP